MSGPIDNNGVKNLDASQGIRVQPGAGQQNEGAMEFPASAVVREVPQPGTTRPDPQEMVAGRFPVARSSSPVAESVARQEAAQIAEPDPMTFVPQELAQVDTVGASQQAAAQARESQV